MPKPVDWLNYQHLLYFWMVAKCGTVAEAARRLHLTSPTISAQIRKLEHSTGRQLLKPKGRTLELTDAGQVVMGYADRIFGLGSELGEVLLGQSPEGKLRLRVGIVDAVPKLIVHGLLTPVFKMQPIVQLHCSEGLIDSLTEALVTHELDVIISDVQIPPRRGSGVYNHPLGKSSTSFFASPKLIGANDPRSLTDLLKSEAMLLPATGSALRRQLDQYFDDLGVIPSIAHEFNDTALMKVFGEAGAGIFPGPSVVEQKICQQYSVRCLGRVDQLKETFFAITAERQIDHPAVELLTQTASINSSDSNEP